MHRRYNRWWARFEQPNPYDGSYDMTDPQSFNRYSYVLNDPVNFVDPTGLVTYDGAADPHLIADGLVGGLTWAIQHGGVLAFNHGIRIADTLYAYWSFSFFTQDIGGQDDCLTFARILDAFAQRAASNPDFIKMVWDRFQDPNDRSFAARGFKGAFVDRGDSPNQVRHAAGAITAGYGGGVIASVLPQGTWPDGLRNTIAAFNEREKSYSYHAIPYPFPHIAKVPLPTTQSQQADMNLNAAAVPIGFWLGTGIIGRTDVGNVVRENICE